MQNANPTTSKDNPAIVPVSLLQSGQLLALKRECKGGLILQRRFYADFVGPGAAVGGSFDIDCTLIYVIGTVEFYVPSTFAERRAAFGQRMAYIEILKELVLEPSRLNRACMILDQLCQWVRTDAAIAVPDELVAQLVALRSQTVAIARQSYQLPRELVSEKRTNY